MFKLILSLMFIVVLFATGCAGIKETDVIKAHARVDAVAEKLHNKIDAQAPKVIKVVDEIIQVEQIVSGSAK